MSMLSRLRSFCDWEGQPGRPAPRRQESYSFRPSLEGLEDRRVMNAGVGAQAALGAALAAPSQAPPTVSLNFTGVTAQNGQLVGHGVLQGQSFTAPLTLTPAVSATGTPILDLHLNAIHLNVLGLKLDTSNICLDITAQPGTPLGNLLSGLAGGTSLSSLLNNLTSTQLGALTSDLTSILNGVAGQLTAPSSIGTPAAPTSHTTDLLHLSLGPVNLNLLGLNVHLDNCANGPVTVDLSAQKGPGDLLGNLLTSLSHSLDHRIGMTATDQVLTQLADDILSLV